MISKINYKILDAHAHIGYTNDAYRMSPEEIIEYMDRIGIERIAVSSMDALGYKPEEGNQYVYELVEKYPERFSGYIVVNPYFVDGIEDYLDMNFKRKNIVGIKLHPDIHRYQPCGLNYLRIYEYANKYSLMILNHTFGNSKAIEEIAFTYPNVKIIVGHGASATNKDEINYLAKALKNRKNIYFDTTSSSVAPGGIEYFVESFGSDKVIFGTDQPYLDPAFQVGRMQYVRISESERHRIMRSNFEELM